MNEIANKVIVGIIDIVTLAILFFYSFKHKKENGPLFTTKFIARVGVFASISAILYCVPYLKFAIPGFPSFLEIHFDEIPAFFAGFAFGPISGIAVILIKTIIKLPMTSTLCVGELTDLILSTAFILPAAIIYKKHRTFKGALLGILVGTLLQIVIAMLSNVYLMIPFYEFVMGFKEGMLLGLMQKANPAIRDVGWSYALFAVLPFNAIKDAAIIIITLLVYKPLHRFIEKIHA